MSASERGEARAESSGRFPPFVVALKWSLFVVCAVALAGCAGSTSGEAREQQSAGDEAPASGRAAIDRCTERFLQRIAAEGDVPESEEEAIRRYVEDSYCSRFTERGWVYDDGALSIAAYESTADGGEEEGEGVPGRRLILDCALLHHVRQSEVREYVEKLRRQHHDVECQDGTPTAELGVP